MKNKNNYRFIHDCLDNNDTESLKSIFNHDKIEEVYKKNHKGLHHLILRYFLQINNEQMYVSYINRLVTDNKASKRNLILYVHYLISNNRIKNAFQIYEYYIINKFDIVEKDIELMVKHELGRYLLKYFHKYHITINNKDITSYSVNGKVCSNCNHVLEKFLITDQEQQQLLIIIQKNISKNDYTDLVSKCRSKDYNCVVDGGNVMYYGTGNINRSNYERLICVLEQLKNNCKPLLVLHRRHFNRQNKKKYSDLIQRIKTICPLYLTPYHQNDDIYILGAAILKKSYIVTNDKFRDHIFNLNRNHRDLIYDLSKEHIINYTIDDYNVLHLKEMIPYSHRIQISESGMQCHIPTSDNRIICL